MRQKIWSPGLFLCLLSFRHKTDLRGVCILIKTFCDFLHELLLCASLCICTIDYIFNFHGELVHLLLYLNLYLFPNFSFIITPLNEYLRKLVPYDQRYTLQICVHSCISIHVYMYSIHIKENTFSTLVSFY